MRSEPFRFHCGLSEGTFPGPSISLSKWGSLMVAFSWILTTLSPGLPHSLTGAIGLGLRPDREAEKKRNGVSRSLHLTMGFLALASNLESLGVGWMQPRFLPRCAVHEEIWQGEVKIVFHYVEIAHSVDSKDSKPRGAH